MLNKYLYVMRGVGGRVAGLLSLSVSAAFLMAFVDPIAMKLLIDEGLGERNLPLFVAVIAVVMALAIVVSLLKLFEGLLAQRIKNDICGRLSGRMLAAYYRTPYGRVVSEGDGHFMSRVYEEPRKAVDVVVGSIHASVSHVVTLITAMSISLYLSWRVTLVLLLVVPLLYWLSSRFSKRIVRESKRENECEADFRRHLGRGLHSYLSTNNFGNHSNVSASILGSLNLYFDALYRRIRSAMIYRTASGMSMALAESAVLAVAAIDVFMGNMTVGGMMAYMAGFWKLMGGATGLISLLPEYSRAYGYIERLQEFECSAKSDLNPVLVDGADRLDHVDLKSVSFGFSSLDIFQSLDFHASMGDRVLVIGKNGAGKSTLALIMSGYLKQRDGAVHGPTRDRTCVMIPPPKFFFSTLAEHFDQPDVSADRLALMPALLSDFNLDSKLHQDPESYSEGEKRKAYIAMCLLKDADLYVFDEPLAAVDEQSKPLVIDWILRLTTGRILIVIMHGDECLHGRFNRVLLLQSTTPQLVETKDAEERPPRESLRI